MLRSEDHGPVRVLTFDRPEVKNAFGEAMYLAVGAALDAARDDDAVAAVVLTGSGDAFSSGQDLGELAALGERARAGDLADDEESSGFNALMEALGGFDKPLLGVVNGVAVGIGFTLLAHLDLVLVSPTARFRVPFAPMGVAPEAGSSALFPERMGWQRAAEALLLGDWMSADEVVTSGLALRISDDVLTDTIDLATRIAASPLSSLRAIKRTMLSGRAERVAAARAIEEREFAALLAGYGGG